jgi:aldose 1-epimerase
MSEINKQFCYSDSSGADIFLFTLKSKNGTEVKITNYGAIITAYTVKQKDGTYNDIVLGFDKVEEYTSKEYLSNYPFFGAAIGRYGNRIKNGQFVLDGQQYHLAKNTGTDHLHGGNSGFDKKVWTVVSYKEEPVASLTLQYISADGEEGYPGELTVTLQFELSAAGELTHTYTATTTKPTAVNLTHHSYFNLDIQKKKVDEHIVQLNCATYLEQDENYTVTGQLIPVKNTAFDFLSPRTINKNWDPAEGFDQSFVINSTTGAVAAAYSAESGLRLSIYTTEPIVHFYTGKWMPTIAGKNNILYKAFHGFCFETQVHPNAINIAEFPDTVLRPGETYRTSTTYKVSMDELK